MSNISVFRKANDTAPAQTVSINDFISGIKFGKWQNLVIAVRNELDKVNRKALKEKLPCVTIGGTFSKRSESGLLAHSGFICIDIDDFTDKSRIINDRYTYACFDSVSGNGFAVIVKIRPDKHKDSFRWIQSYYFNTYGITVDPAPSNVASLRYVSHDPNVETNENSAVSKTLIPPKKQSPSLPIILSTDVVSGYVREAASLGIDLAPTYQEYVTLGFAIANGFGETGREYFHALTSVNDKYEYAHANRQYDLALRDHGSNKVTVGTFYYLLKAAGVQISHGDQRAVQVATIAKRAKRDKSSTIQQLVEVNNIAPEAARALVEEVFSRTDITLGVLAKDPENLIQTVTQWLVQSHPIKKNTITRKFETTDGELSEERLNTIFLQARAEFNTPHITFDLVNRVIRSEVTPQYNPFTEFIEKNRHIHTTGHINTLLSSVASETPMSAIWMRKWLIGIVAAIHGHPVRYMLILIGRQFSGKTEFFRRLLPAELKQYFGESHFDRGKDDEIMMCQKLIILDDEMGGKSKSDEKLLKELTSKDIFTLRVPYGHGNEDLKRLAILCGTSNEKAIINDRTGNTRMLPIEIDSIDFEAYNSVDKTALLMEIVRAYESGEEWQLSQDEFTALAESGFEFETVNSEMELLMKYFQPFESAVGTASEMSITDIKDYIESQSSQQMRNVNWLGREARKFFGRPKQDYKSGARTYTVYKIEQFAPDTRIVADPYF